MGYSTDFYGSLDITPAPSSELKTFVSALNKTRRVKRAVDPMYGIEGEFYVHGKGFMGQDSDDTVVNPNQPPSTQPGLWMNWNIDSGELEWDGGEKFYNYIEWLSYLINNVFAPLGYKLNGQISWRGEDNSDIGVIKADDNKLTVYYGIMFEDDGQEEYYDEERDDWFPAEGKFEHRIMKKVFEESNNIRIEKINPRPGKKLDLKALLKP